MSSLQHVPLPPSGKKTTNVRFEKKVENNKKNLTYCISQPLQINRGRLFICI